MHDCGSASVTECQCVSAITKKAQPDAFFFCLRDKEEKKCSTWFGEREKSGVSGVAAK